MTKNEQSDPPQAVEKSPAAGKGEVAGQRLTTREIRAHEIPAAATPCVVLSHPQLGENIGASARAMANFGLSNLRLVSPRDGWPNEQARKSASGADYVVDAATVFRTTQDALGDLHYIVATTARPRDMVKPVLTPQSAAAELRRRICAGQRVGILFGPERTGLENHEIALADAIVMAPVNPNFASINLAQAVLLVGYEWFKVVGGEAGVGRHTQFDGIKAPGPQFRRSRPATRSELIGFFEHLESALDATGFFRTPEKRPNMVRNLRNMFGRIEATEQEVRTLRGIVASLVGAHRRRSDAS